LGGQLYCGEVGVEFSCYFDHSLDVAV